MTCIVALKDPDNRRVVMGGDAAVTWTASLAQRVMARPKVFRKGDLLIGWSGSIRALQIVEFCIPAPRIPDGVDLHAWLVRAFVAQVRKAFTDGGYMQEHESGRDDMDSWCLIAAQGRIFQLDDDFQLTEYLEPYAAVGCGTDFALGSLAQSAKEGARPASQRIDDALGISEALSGGVKRPFTVLCIDDDPPRRRPAKSPGKRGGR